MTTVLNRIDNNQIIPQDGDKALKRSNPQRHTNRD